MAQKFYKQEDVQKLVGILKKMVIYCGADELDLAIEALQDFSAIEPVSLPEFDESREYQVSKNDGDNFASGIKFENQRIRRAMEGET